MPATMGKPELEAATRSLGLQPFHDPGLLERALTHKTFANETAPVDEVQHNERLEFLGDAVLALVISEQLMQALPDAEEGELSELRASLVNRDELSELGAGLGLGQLLRLGRGEDQSGGRAKPSILADAFEALLGAVYLDQGLEPARALVQRVLGPRLAALQAGRPVSNPKSRLQELLQGRGERPPEYVLLGTSGPPHERVFTVAARQGEREIGRGAGRSKKAAEQEAARQVLAGMNEEPR
jgi:ribonuclease III